MTKEEIAEIFNGQIPTYNKEITADYPMDAWDEESRTVQIFIPDLKANDNIEYQPAYAPDTNEHLAWKAAGIRYVSHTDGSVKFAIAENGKIPQITLSMKITVKKER